MSTSRLSICCWLIAEAGGDAQRLLDSAGATHEAILNALQ